MSTPARTVYGALVLRYDTVVDGVETTVTLPVSERTVGVEGTSVAHLAAAGRVWNVAVLDADGADITSDFDCFY